MLEVPKGEQALLHLKTFVLLQQIYAQFPIFFAEMLLISFSISGTCGDCFSVCAETAINAADEAAAAMRALKVAQH